MRIQTNVAAQNALRNIGVTENMQNRSIEKLSSGFRLNRAGDDAAGMSIANSLRSNGRALQQAQRNTSQANSFLQIADGGVQTLSTMLDRMRELATEGASDNVTTTDRQKIDAEFKQLQSEWDRTINTTTYQGQKLLSGTFGVTDSGTLKAMASAISNVNVSNAAAGTTYTITQTAATAVTLSDGKVSQTVTTTAGSASTSQSVNFDKLGISFTINGALGATDLNAKTVVTGASAAAAFRVGGGTGDMNSDDMIKVALDNLTAATVGIDSTGVADVLTTTNAAAALAKIDTALSKVNTAIGTIGAAQNRLDYASANVNSLVQNISAAESTIRDADMAQEYTNYSKLQILQQAGTAMLAQANSSSQSVLQLLRG